MKYLLSRENAKVLAQYASSRVLVAFDFDGTLAPIVEKRDGARMRAKTEKLLMALCKRYPCAVISGRSRADVTRRLGGAAVKYVAGNHGIELGTHSDSYDDQIRRARARLEALLANEPGIELEDKRYSLALHYRNSRRRRNARDAIVRAVSSLRMRVRIVPGKLVLNVVPEGAPNKGDALLALRSRVRADTAIFVGDDITDEDVFDLDQPGRLLTVRVGESRSSSAAYFLRDQGEIDVLLAKLSGLREHGAER